MTAMKALNLAELYALELPQLAFRIEGIIPSGSITLLAGREKAGKTLLVTDMMCAIATEEPFLGREVDPGPILYLPAEEHLREVRTRLRLRLAGRNAPIVVAPANGQLGQRLQLSDPHSVGQLIESIRELQPVVVIIDPLREVHSGAENDSDEMAPLMRPLRQIAHELDTAIVLLHHMSKGSNARGSTAIAAAVDQIITFTRTSEEIDGVKGRMEVNGRFGTRISLHVELADGLRWKVSNAIHFEPLNARDRIVYLLESSTVAMTAKAITERLDGLELKSIQNTLASLLSQQPSPIVASGTGKKGDPRVYSSVNPSLFECERNDSPRSHNPRESDVGNHFESFPDGSGNNGNHPGSHSDGRPCDDCGEPIEPGLNFRCLACIAQAKARVAA